jgi:hypothetical protein
VPASKPGDPLVLGLTIVPYVRTGQGAVVSPLLANIYLHYGASGQA